MPGRGLRAPRALRGPRPRLDPLRGGRRGVRQSLGAGRRGSARARVRPQPPDDGHGLRPGLVRGHIRRVGRRAVPAGPARPAARPGRRRVPALRQAYPDAYALLDTRFWCLPDRSRRRPPRRHGRAGRGRARGGAARPGARARRRSSSHSTRPGDGCRGALCSARSPTASTPGCSSAATPHPSGCCPRPRSPCRPGRLRCRRRRWRWWSTAGADGTSTVAPCRAATTSRSTRTRGRAEPARGSPPTNGCAQLTELPGRAVEDVGQEGRKRRAMPASVTPGR